MCLYVPYTSEPRGSPENAEMVEAVKNDEDEGDEEEKREMGFGEDEGKK